MSDGTDGADRFPAAPGHGDPGQTRSIVGPCPEQVAQFEADLDAWHAQYGTPVDLTAI